jgi:NAD(P)H-dependent flavin oxidoreductase YrpB (nitropropane dioxygenase family)
MKNGRGRAWREGGAETTYPGIMLIPPQVNVIAAGGIYDGRGLAAMLMYGAQAVWVGTRFVAATEAAAPKKHKDL